MSTESNVNFLMKYYNSLKENFRDLGKVKIDKMFCSAVNELVKDKQVDNKSYSIVKQIYGIEEKSSTIKTQQPTRVTTCVDPCSRGYSGSSRGGC